MGDDIAPASLNIAKLESNNSSLVTLTSLPAKGPLSYLNLLGPEQTQYMMDAFANGIDNYEVKKATLH